MAEPWFHYIVVREDLPHGARYAQIAHAAGESAKEPLPSDTRACVLGAKNEKQLVELAAVLLENKVEFVAIMESDGGLADQMTAIGVRPSTPREAVKPRVAHLGLLR